MLHGRVQGMYIYVIMTSNLTANGPCQNCTMKPPSSSLLKSRLRRLCSTCLAAPLSAHLSPQSPLPPNHSPPHESQVRRPASLSFRASPCTCNDEVWFCRPCGQTLHSDDTTYIRVFSWRTRYSVYLGGGLGAGMGDTCQGVPCGRGDRCLAAEEIEVEIDCDVDDSVNNNEHAEHYPSSPHDGEKHHHHHSHSHPHADDEGPGYLRQEIMGVGGVVKHKVKKRVKVGASVEEHDDERESSVYLRREARGEVRSWCGWCDRVVPGK